MWNATGYSYCKDYISDGTFTAVIGNETHCDSLNGTWVEEDCTTTMSGVAMTLELSSYLNVSDRNVGSYCDTNLTAYNFTTNIASFIGEVGETCCSSGRSMCMAEPSNVSSGQPRGPHVNSSNVNTTSHFKSTNSTTNSH